MVNQEYFIPQMHHLLRKKLPIMWLWKNKLKVSQTAKAVFCLLFGVFPLRIHPSLSFSLSHLLVSLVFTPFSGPVLATPLAGTFPHPSLLGFFFLSTCVFSRAGEPEQDGLRRWARYWLSFVFLICFISVQCWEEGWGNAKTMRIR